MGVMCDLNNCFPASRVEAHVESKHQLCIVIRSCYSLLKGQNSYPSTTPPPLPPWVGILGCPHFFWAKKTFPVKDGKEYYCYFNYIIIWYTFSLSFSSKTTVPVAIIKSLTAREEVELLYTLQLTVADPNWPFCRSIFTDTLEDSGITTGLMEVNPNKPLALSLLSTKKTRLTTKF